MRELRLRRALTLADLHERIRQESGFEISQPTLTRIEKEKRSVYDFEVVALARALRADARWLLGMIDELPDSSEPSPGHP
ncbi:helix-turn-helix domain-containing protein [Deinococcus taeanensis]|uniref:helix-turn-helix domain-containing protein n=1 Tax=Deinococcus taeanensis TaxID=2737050 RepID=UPI00210824FF|nr:helix-turn-helix transcriptional regulator [Deinococcus taeanensis]